jgi:hypothetical protein
VEFSISKGQLNMSTNPNVGDPSAVSESQPQANGELLPDGATDHTTANAGNDFVSRSDYESLQAQLKGLQKTVDRNQTDTQKFLEKAKSIGLDVSPEKQRDMSLAELAQRVLGTNQQAPR